jgi:hypothetical protein
MHLQPQFPASGQVFTFSFAPAAGPAMPLQAPSSSIQDLLTDFAGRITGWLERTGLPVRSGPGAIVPRMVRAALLDKNIYREGPDASVKYEPLLVVAVVVLLGIVGPLLFALPVGSGLSQFVSVQGIKTLGLAAIIQFAVFFAGVVIAQVLGAVLLKQPVDRTRLLHALAYAQAPAALNVFGGVGQLTEFWRVVTMTAALRDTTNGDTTRSGILAVIITLAGAFLSAFLANLFVKLQI